MKKDSAIITIFSLVFIIVLITTVVLSIKFATQDKQSADDAGSQPTEASTPEATQTPDITGSNQAKIAPEEFKIELEQLENNDFIDLYLSNPENIAAIEVTIKLPDNVNYLSTADQDLFYDIIAKQTGKELKVGGLSLQVISPKSKQKFVRLFFDKPLTEKLTITNQIFLDQQNNEI